ncbi:MAG: glycosyl hydrolase family 65 protein [Acidimicrobiia bacterium]
MQRPAALDRRFEAILFDWDGTAVPDRSADATRVRALIEALCTATIDVAIVTGTHVGNVDGQLQARPSGPGRLLMALNRGSEVFDVGPDGPQLVYRREASPEEDDALDAAAQLTVARLAERGLTAEIVSNRLNRRKIDLIPVPEWHDPPKARIDALLDAVTTRLLDAGINGLREAVAIAESAAREVGLASPRVTSDAKHVEIGLTDKSDSAAWLMHDFAGRGIVAEHVLVAGDEFGPLGGLPGSDSLLLVPETQGCVAFSVGVEPNGVPTDVLSLQGGPDTFLAILEDQLARRERLELPVMPAAPGWTIPVDGFDPQLERVHETLLTVADGVIGTRGAPMFADHGSMAQVLANGVYRGDGPTTHLLTGPVWHRLECECGHPEHLVRRLDLRGGLLHETCESPAGHIHGVRFSSLARPGTAVLRAQGPAIASASGALLIPPDGGEEPKIVGVGDDDAFVIEGEPGGIAAAARQRTSHHDDMEFLERVAVYGTSGKGLPSVDEVVARLHEAQNSGFDRLLAEHRAAWARRWADADVKIEGDPDLQLALRFALFHLMASVPDSGEAGIGARGLSGPAYSGHVFWDADVFVLPFLAATHPAAARAMLEYRVRRLPTAIEAAREEGLTGARFPWESAYTGRDVTPTSVRNREGVLVPIRTGRLEVHIVADIAWAAAFYLDWTGDDDFARGDGAEIFVQTARYWASRIRPDGDGHGHILGVVGPDEYHEPVDDSAFTNVMARWNLRRAAAATMHRSDVSVAERAEWLRLASSLVDGYDADTGIYEQFAGFHALEPIIIEELIERPIAADMLLGRERVRGAQVIKQADVLMLHHLVPDEVEPGSLEANLRYYEPRTAHGSSLSPGIHASLLARARDDQRALDALRIASHIDLEDLTDTTAGGLHMATLGAMWQAIAFGFGGIRARHGGVLHVDPRLPKAWSSWEITTRFRGSRVQLRKDRGSATIVSEQPIAVAAGDSTHTVGPAGITLIRHGSRWEAP